jgi:hypothetical protein
LNKGGLIVEKISQFDSNLQVKFAKSLSWVLCTKKEKKDLAPLFVDLSQNEQISEIKPPLKML